MTTTFQMLAASALPALTDAYLQALAAAGISATYISETTADPAPPPGGTAAGLRGARRTAAGGWQRLTWTGSAWQAVGAVLLSTGGGQMTAPLQDVVLTRATLPSASTCPGGRAAVSDPEGGQPRTVYSDGTVWRYSTGAAVNTGSAAPLPLEFDGTSLGEGWPATFTRASTAWNEATGAFAAAGVLRTRVLGRLTAYRIEGSAVNMAPTTEAFDVTTSAWTKRNATLTPNTLTAPDGTLTGDTLTATTTAAPSIERTYNAIATDTLTSASVAVHAPTNRYAGITFSGTGVFLTALYDVLSGTVSVSGPGFVNAFVSRSRRGWYRVGVSATLTAAMGTTVWKYNVTDGANSQIGSVGRSVGLWGAQIEAGNATSYFPNAAALPTTSTRAADALTIPNAPTGDYLVAVQSLVTGTWDRFWAAHAGGTFTVPAGWWVVVRGYPLTLTAAQKNAEESRLRAELVKSSENIALGWY